MRAYRLLQENPSPSEEEIRFGISGNLCRCTGYQNIVKAIQYAAAKITTIEGMANADGSLHALQEGFRMMHGLQCGYCTPGMIMRAHRLLQENPNPSEQEIRFGIAGNLCRCTGYQNIVKAIQYAAAKLSGAAHVEAAQ